LNELCYNERMMNGSMFRNVLKWLGWLACAGWLLFAIDREIFELDPGQMGFRAPSVEAEMKNCTSEDMRLRYDCKEQAILANQRMQFLKAAGRWFFIFGPPIVVGMLGRRLLRERPRVPLRTFDTVARRRPSIEKWRVK
jgi:hypothetical protein